MKRLLLYVILAAFGLTASLVATSPVASERVSVLHTASFWCSVPGALLSQLMLPRKYTVFYCFGEPPPHQTEIGRSAVVASNTLFWPGLLACVFGSTYCARRWGQAARELVSGILHSPALLTSILFAALAAFFLARSLYGNQSTDLVRYFWPGVVCFLIAATAFVSWLLARLGLARHTQHNDASSHERI
jgi:hypothetical protein